jgi:hypothetical protein
LAPQEITCEPGQQKEVAVAMSITTKISAAIAGTAFALLAVGAVTLSQGTPQSSHTVVADNPWGTPPTTTPNPATPQGNQPMASDDNPWGH